MTINGEATSDGRALNTGPGGAGGSSAPAADRATVKITASATFSPS